MTIVLTKKFLDTSNLNLIKVQNDVGLNRLAPPLNYFLVGLKHREGDLLF